VLTFSGGSFVYHARKENTSSIKHEGNVCGGDPHPICAKTYADISTIR
jgi:hypothetical protein